MNDNRQYYFELDSIAHREEYLTIAGWIPAGSRVIDLGSGDGSLLALLKTRGVIGEGMEISASGVKATRRKGIKARQGRIDQPLPFQDHSFDCAICNVTIQMVMYPEVLVQEMKRIAKYQIISFPNFAFFPNRLELFFQGRMPKTMLYGYKWYSTGHIHQFSIQDFEEFCRKQRLLVVKTHFRFPNRVWIVPGQVFKMFPNVWSTVAIYLLTPDQP